MQSTDTRAAVAALLMLTLLISGCVEEAGQEPALAKTTSETHPRTPSRPSPARPKWSPARVHRTNRRIRR